MEDNFITFMKLVKIAYLQEETGETTQYVKYIKLNGFPKKVSTFYNLCRLLNRSPYEFSDCYIKELDDIIKSRCTDIERTAKTLEVSNITMKNLVNVESRSVKFFLKAYKIFKHLRPQKNWDEEGDGKKSC